MRRLIAFAAVGAASSALTAAAIALPATAGDGDEPSARERAAPPRSGDDAAAFERCMREHGVDLSGAEVVVLVRPGRVTVNGEEVDPETFRAAERACRELLPHPPRLGRAHGRLPDPEALRRCLEEEVEAAPSAAA